MLRQLAISPMPENSVVEGTVTQEISDFLGSMENPTSPFQILEPQNPWFDEIFAVQERF